MDNKDPDIISKQASAISILAVIVLILIIVVFFFGYCEPRHEKMNENKSTSSTEQGVTATPGTMPPGTSTQASTDQSGAAGKADSSQSK